MEEEDPQSNLSEILKSIPDESLLNGLEGIVGGHGLVPCSKIAELIKRINERINDLNRSLSRKSYISFNSKGKIKEEIETYENIIKTLYKCHARLYAGSRK